MRSKHLQTISLRLDILTPYLDFIFRLYIQESPCPRVITSS